MDLEPRRAPPGRPRGRHARRGGWRRIPKPESTRLDADNDFSARKSEEGVSDERIREFSHSRGDN